MFGGGMDMEDENDDEENNEMQVEENLALLNLNDDEKENLKRD